MKRLWTWIATIAGLLAAGLFYGWTRFKQGVDAGDAKATTRADRERLREADESGDPNRLLDEWRRR